MSFGICSMLPRPCRRSDCIRAAVVENASRFHFRYERNSPFIRYEFSSQLSPNITNSTPIFGRLLDGFVLNPRQKTARQRRSPDLKMKHSLGYPAIAQPLPFTDAIAAVLSSLFMTRKRQHQRAGRHCLACMLVCDLSRLL